MHDLCSILLHIIESWGVEESNIIGKERLSTMTMMISWEGMRLEGYLKNDKWVSDG